MVEQSMSVQKATGLTPMVPPISTAAMSKFSVPVRMTTPLWTPMEPSPSQAELSALSAIVAWHRRLPPVPVHNAISHLEPRAAWGQAARAAVGAGLAVAAAHRLPPSASAQATLSKSKTRRAMFSTTEPPSEQRITLSSLPPL